MNSKKYILLCCWLFISTILSICLYTRFYDIRRGADMISLNDEWEHQSMAVNYAEGFGLYKLGAYTSIEKYHIDTYDATFPFLRKLFTEYPTEYYHRAAGFSVIAGTVYKIFGTHPFYLRVFNFFLIILSWLLVCYAIYYYEGNNKKAYYLVSCLPLYIVLNYSYIDLIGDDTLVIFSLSIVFFCLLKWIKNPVYGNTLLFVLAVSYSVFIKSTLLLIPLFILLISLFSRRKQYILKSLILNAILLLVVTLYSDSINEKHKSYKYVNQDAFHTEMLNSKWSKQDSDFIQLQHLQFKKVVNFDFNTYKNVAVYLFERQFYSKRKFLLSGQSLYLLIDGNNEACIGFAEKHIGSWKPFWKFNKTSFYYNYNENLSPYSEIIKFYLQNPVFLPLIMYSKLFAGYYWNYLFILLSVLQLFYCFLIYFRAHSGFSFAFYFTLSILLHILFYFLYLTPFIVVVFAASFLYVAIKNKNEYTISNIFYISNLFIFYFLFLTLLMFGLYRYTGISNSMQLIALVYLWFEIIDRFRANKLQSNYLLNSLTS